MDKISYLEKLHWEIVTILDEVVRICDLYNLKYYLIGGTLLGAVRHSGFIPWDDDLDIVMPRHDYELFVNKYYKALHKDYYLEWINTDKYYYRVFAKVCKRNTIFEEEIGNISTTKHGIFIDIFPMDTSSGNIMLLQNNKNKMIYFAGKMYNKRIAIDERKISIKKALLKLIPSRMFLCMAEYYMKKDSKPNSMYYSNFGSQYNIKRQTIPIDYYGDGILYVFEGQKYRIPDNYDGVLKSIYGADYMKLPSEDKRRTHYPIRVLFSDGNEIYFGRSKNKLFVGKD